MSVNIDALIRQLEVLRDQMAAKEVEGLNESDPVENVPAEEEAVEEESEDAGPVSLEDFFANKQREISSDEAAPIFKKNK